MSSENPTKSKKPLLFTLLFALVAAGAVAALYGSGAFSSSASESQAKSFGYAVETTEASYTAEEFITLLNRASDHPKDLFEVTSIEKLSGETFQDTDSTRSYYLVKATVLDGDHVSATDIVELLEVMYEEGDLSEYGIVGILKGGKLLTKTTTAPTPMPTPTLTPTPPMSALTLSSESLDFGVLEAASDASVTSELVLTNTGSTDLIVNSMSVAGMTDYVTLDASAPLTISAGQAHTLVVAFHHVMAGNFTGTLSISCSASASPHVVSLKATVTVAPKKAHLTNTAENIVFETVEPLGGISNGAFGLVNSHSESVTISKIGFTSHTGDEEAFTLNVEGTKIASPGFLDLETVIPAGKELIVAVQFHPQSQTTSTACGYIYGDFESVPFCFEGTGAPFTDAHFLHPTIDVSPVIVDYDANGVETVFIDGRSSHTHEPDRSLVQFKWSVDFVPVDTNEQTITVDLTEGFHFIVLEIVDDMNSSLGAYQNIRVVPSTDVPGTTLRYYPTATPVASLNAVTDPSSLITGSTFTEVLTEVKVFESISGTLGQSAYKGDVMVHFASSLKIVSDGDYTFSIDGKGYDACRVFIDSVETPLGTSSTRAKGTYSLDFLCAVSAVSGTTIELILDNSVIDNSQISRNEKEIKPFINEVSPSEGSVKGGDLVSVTGVGFVSPVVLSIGGVSVPEADFVSKDFSQITFRTPALPEGELDVTVGSSAKTSNGKKFSAKAQGNPPPVKFNQFDLDHSIVKPTCGEFGPDGRLYVGTREGEIHILTLDKDYKVTASEVITTVKDQSEYPEILGLTFSPFDDPAEGIKVYVSHNALYYGGGKAFDLDMEYPYCGEVSMLQGPLFDTLIPIVTGLPNHDHGINEIEFSNDGSLIIASGGNTNGGVIAGKIGGMHESPLSAGIVEAKIYDAAFNGEVKYVRRDNGEPENRQGHGDKVRVADSVSGVSMYAHGFRNAFGCAYTTSEEIFCADQGPNGGYGPYSTGPDSEIPDTFSVKDEICKVEKDHYYGHPNRNRGLDDSRQNIYYDVSEPSIPGVFTQCFSIGGTAYTGIVEYRGASFQESLRGDLIFQQWRYKTFRFNLPEQKKTNIDGLELKSLNLVYAPQGCIVGIQYHKKAETGSDKISVGCPVDDSLTATSAPYALDIFPWRAVPQFGVKVSINGHNFKSVASVEIGGATLSEIVNDASEITGVLSVPLSPVYRVPQNVVIKFTDGSQTVLSSAFTWIEQQ